MNRKRPSLALLAAVGVLGRLVVPSVTASELPPPMEEQLTEQFQVVRSEFPGAFEAVDPNDYRHPYERRVVEELLADPKVKALLPQAHEMAAEFNEQYHRQHLLNGVLASETQFPELYQMAMENAEALFMKKSIKLYIMNSAQMNAYTWSIDQDNYGVALYSGIINGMTEDELRFVLAHEMGHVKSKHILTTILVQLYQEKYQELPEVFQADDDDDSAEKIELPGTYLAESFAHLPAPLASGLARRVGGGVVKPMQVTQAEMDNFNRLQQAAEYSSDRAGIVGTGDRKQSMMGLVKLASGHVSSVDGFDLEQYLEQIESVLADLTPAQLDGVLMQEGSHAFTLMRVAEAGRFFDSDAYADAARTKDSSIFRRIVSAYYQSSKALGEAREALKSFQEAEDVEEINSLERRMKERALAKAVEERTGPEGALRPLVSETIEALGLKVANPGFDLMLEYVLTRGEGAPMQAVASELVERLNFELQQPDLTPSEREELERKLSKAKALPELGEDDEAEETLTAL